jgi:hypothetical protein
MSTNGNTLTLRDLTIEELRRLERFFAQSDIDARIEDIDLAAVVAALKETPAGPLIRRDDQFWSGLRYQYTLWDPADPVSYPGLSYEDACARVERECASAVLPNQDAGNDPTRRGVRLDPDDD